ncbi:MAG: hypothetical protein NWF05_02635 [Candidatus Bathyarchaeota archaeon]|nr:hypothetical protein [Candidatus Bathyarchaeota archaeon]
MQLLVGDNPFHDISHLSQERARTRIIEESDLQIAEAANLVKASLQTGATGFMFSVSETTLSILKSVSQTEKLELYAIVPYAYEYVRLATKTGGISGLAKKVIREIAFSSNIIAIAPNTLGVVRADLNVLLKTYIIYEISRVKAVSGKNAKLKSVLLHEIITDMALALDLDWLLKSYITFLKKRRIRPGFETRNFTYLVDKFEEWNIDFSEITITAPFNRVGFQMNPSKTSCEKALQKVAGAEVVAMSVLAAGYLKPAEAAGYLKILPNVTHTVVGVSKMRHATETFRLLEQEFARSTSQM